MRQTKYSLTKSRYLDLMKTTKTQFLEKKLLIFILLVEIAGIGTGLSSPAHSTTLKTFQSTESAVKSKLISKEVAEDNLLASIMPRRICIWVGGRQICWWK